MLAAQIQAFKQWWHRPITARDRILGAVIGGMGAFWIGILSWMFFHPLPAPFENIFVYVASSIASGTLLGTLFPKSVSLISFPFAIFGGGN